MNRSPPQIEGCNVIVSSRMLKFKINRRPLLFRHQSLYSDWDNFIAVRPKHEERGRHLDSLSTYPLWCYSTTKLFSLAFKTQQPEFSNSYFYIFSILITYCFILSIIITLVRNRSFPKPVNKPWFIYPHTVHVILTWGVKPNRHLFTCFGLCEKLNLHSK